MGMPFPEAAAGAEPAAKPKSYTDILVDIEHSLPGHEIAKNVLALFKKLQDDKQDFSIIYAFNPPAKLTQMLADTNAMVKGCKGDDAVYFHPDNTYSKIEATFSESDAHTAWMKSQMRVYQFAVGSVLPGPAKNH